MVVCSKTRSCDGQQKPNLDRAGQSRTRAKKCQVDFEYKDQLLTAFRLPEVLRDK